MHHPDFCIAGAGIIGLSLALELHRRGATVTILERGLPLSEASYAAAGMLAANDPDNPAALQPLANLSLALYPEYLARIAALSRQTVPFQTHITLQAHPTPTPFPVHTLLPQLQPGTHTFQYLDEHSIDPRQLAAALLAAVRATPIDLRVHTAIQSVNTSSRSVTLHTPSVRIAASHFIDCTGAWASHTSPLIPIPVTPRKGQMLALALPTSLPLELVLRTPDIYIVPRTHGPHAGRAIVGATIEDCGFDKTIHPIDISHLHRSVAALLPSLADATVLDTWAGLRPATPDGLPLLGPIDAHGRHHLATGHYRNGILLAPATAHLIAQSLTGEPTSIDLTPYAPTRTLNSLSQ